MTALIPTTNSDDITDESFGRGNVIRVGQEDNVTERPGRLFKSNAEQIEKIKRILDEFDIGVMTAAEARQRLGLGRLNS